MSVGTRMRRLRVARGLTQRELAEPDYTHAYVSTIEAGKRRPSAAALRHFAAKLGIDVQELATGRAPDHPYRLRLRLHDARAALSTGDVAGAEPVFAGVERSATRHSFTRIRAAAIVGLGRCVELGGRCSDAEQTYAHAHSLLVRGPPTASVEAVAGMARCRQELGDTSGAIHLLESLLDTLGRRGLEDPLALVTLHATLVGAYWTAGLVPRAAASATESLRLWPSGGTAAGSGMWADVARVLLEGGHLSDADRALTRAEDADRIDDLRPALGRAHLARGYVMAREHDGAGARIDLGTARSIFETTGRDEDLSSALTELGRLDRVEGRIESARSLLEAALARSTGDAGRAGAHRELGHCEAPIDAASSEKHFRSAIRLFERAGRAVDAAITRRALGDLLLSSGRSKDASDAYRSGIVTLEKRL